MEVKTVVSQEELTCENFVKYLTLEEKKVAVRTETSFNALLRKFIAWAKKLNDDVSYAEFRYKFVLFTKQTIERIHVLHELFSSGRYGSEPSLKHMEDIMQDAYNFMAALAVEIKKQPSTSDHSENKTPVLAEDSSHQQVLQYLILMEEKLFGTNQNDYDDALKLFIGWVKQLETDIENLPFKSQLKEFRSQFLKLTTIAFEKITLLRQKSGGYSEILTGYVIADVCKRLNEFSALLALEIEKYANDEAQEIKIIL